MELREFGSTKLQVPVLGEGTWRMERDDRASAIAAIRRGLDLGLTHIDTAEAYGNGLVETLVAEAIARRRDEAFLVSKVKPSNASRAGTIAACEKSLERLKTDRLDCYLLHWPGSHPLEGTIAAFERLVQDGKIRSYGISNFDEPEIEEAVRIAGPGRIACNQVLYHLEERAIEYTVLPTCARLGIAVVAYSPLGGGRFPTPASAGGKVLQEIAGEHGATPRQVALRFLVQQPNVFAIPKAATVPHVEDNAGASRFSLSDEEIRRIDAAFPARPQRELPML